MRKRAIITGGNTGLGFDCADRALSSGFEVTLACRNSEKATLAKSKLQSRYPESAINIMTLDLSDIESAKDFASNYKGKWDLLINNAGAKIEQPFKQTKQGHEWHVGVNHLGHFALTAGLYSKAQENATVVTVSSIVARKGSLDFEIEPFDKAQAYANSKLMNLVFSKELARRLDGTGLKSVAAHPGFARASFYGNHMVRAAEYCFAQSSWRGSQSIWSATMANNGDYLAPRYLELWGSSSPARLPGIDLKAASEFWNLSEEKTGILFLR